MPPWLSVKHTNTPTEYSGISSVVTPPKATIRAAATADSRMIPQLNASRSPRKANWRGKYPSSASSAASRGNAL